MAKAVRATIASTTGQPFPAATVPSVYRFKLSATGQADKFVDVAYPATAPIVAQFDNLVPATYTVNASLRGTPADTTLLGAILTQTITVTPDDVVLQVPGLLTLTVITS